jgi:hypothetical protein
LLTGGNSHNVATLLSNPVKHFSAFLSVHFSAEIASFSHSTALNRNPLCARKVVIHGLVMGTKNMTPEELAAWHELARAAKKLQQAQRKAGHRRRRRAKAGKVHA